MTFYFTHHSDVRTYRQGNQRPGAQDMYDKNFKNYRHCVTLSLFVTWMYKLFELKVNDMQLFTIEVEMKRPPSTLSFRFTKLKIVAVFRILHRVS